MSKDMIESKEFVENMKKIFESMKENKISTVKLGDIQITRSDQNRNTIHQNPETTDDLMAGLAIN